MLLHILIAMDDPELQAKLQELLTKKDTVVEIVKDQKRLWKKIPRKTSDLLIVSRDFITSGTFEEIRNLTKLSDAPSVVVLSRDEDEDERAKLIAAGCTTVLHSELSLRKLLDALSAVLDRRRKATPVISITRPILTEPEITDFVAESQAMRAFVKVIPRVAKSDSSVLILGETGVGKEKLARVIHAESNRKNGPLIAIHCGALPETLLESELFGHEQGAFTGATKARKGCFELAHQGTIFLDEIGEMQLHLQSKLLRVLESHEIRRVGGEKTINVDVRVIAATNRNLEDEVKAKQFRHDLFYRLNVFSLTIPPLRERIEDIPDLVESYINYLCPRIGCEVSGISEEALGVLSKYSWPGNVRELINVIERAMLLCEDEIITTEDLPQGMTGEGILSIKELTENPKEFPEEWLQRPLKQICKEVLEQFEKSYLTGLLTSKNGHIGKVAKTAGIDSRTLFDKMKKYDLDKKDFR